MNSVKNNLLFSQLWQVIFLFLAAFYIMTTWTGTYPFSWLFKISPILLLIYKALQLSELRGSKLFTIGLCFSLVGDFILDFFGTSGFIFGLASFFMAHVFYLIFFGRWFLNKSKAVIALCVLAYGVLAMSLFIDDLGALFYPVIGYMLVLIFMVFASIFSKKSNGWFILGGLSFILSDSVLGINKFHGEVAYSHMIIMVSYYFAQFSLLKGCIKFGTSSDSVGKL